MDYSFYALVAICIFLLLLTFYLAVKRRRQTIKRQVQSRDEESVIINSISNGSPCRLGPMIRIPQQDNHIPMTNRLSSAVNKPEDSTLQAPPPSYQDYTKDIRLVSLPFHQ